MDKNLLTEEGSKDRQGANACIALGAGVGVLGAASAVLTGVVCPLCIFIAPGLIGLGAFRRWRPFDNINSTSKRVETIENIASDEDNSSNQGSRK